MKLKLISAALLLVIAAPVTQAQYLSINDVTDIFTLQVGGTGNTTPNIGDAGNGAYVDILGPTDSNGVSNIAYNIPNETLTFIFANQVNWLADAYFYQYYTEAGTGTSDLFVIQGLAGTTSDYITFISDPGSMLLPALIAGSTATQQEISAPILETNNWQLAYNTGVDQYYIRSVPEPMTLIMLGLGLLGFGYSRRHAFTEDKGLSA